MGEKFDDIPNSHRKISGNGIFIKSKDIEAFNKMADGGVPIPPENGHEEARAKFEAATNQELSGVFASVREEAFKKAFKKGSAEKKTARFAAVLKEIAGSFINSREGSDTLALSADKKELGRLLLGYCQDSQNLQGLKMPALEKILVSASKKKMAEIEKEEDGKKAAEAARKAAEAVEKKKKTGEGKLKIQEVVKKYRENRVHFNAQGDRLNIVIEDYDAKRDELPVAITDKKTGKFKMERWTVSKLSKSLQEEYTRPEKPVISDNTREKKASTDASGERLKKLKQKVDIQKQLLIRRLEERLKKNDINSKDQEVLIRFRKNLSESTDFKLKIEKFRKKETSKEEERELQIHIDLLNAEIDRKISGKIAEIDEFLAGQNKKAEIVEPVPAEVPSGEKYLGEEIPEEKIKEEIADSENFGTESPNPEPTPAPEPKKPEEDPEEKERRTLERQERLAQLKVEIDQARKEYVEMDYKKNKAHKRLAKFFGNLFDSSSNKSWESDKDVAQCQYFYERKIFEYKNLRLEDAKENGVLGKELGTLLKELSVDDNIELADVHDQVKIENTEGTTREFVVNKMHDAVEWYKKLPLSKKIAVGAVFGLATVATAGGALAGLVGYGVAGRRVFMGMVTGTTVAIGLEAKTRKNMEAAKERKEKEFASQLEGKSEEEIYDLIKGNIDEINSKQELKLSKTKNKNLRNLAIGVGAGTLVGTASHWLGMLKETEAGKEIFSSIHGGVNRVMEYFHHPGSPVQEGGSAVVANDNVEYPGYQDDLKSSLSETKIPAGAGVETGVSTAVPGAEQAEAPVVGGAGVAEAGPANEAFHKTFVEGDNVEKSIIGYLKGHPEAVEKYNELSGDKGFDSGDIAHRMAVDYANENGIPLEKLDDVLPGQELELSPDGTKIVEISGDGHMGDVPEEEMSAIPEPDAEAASPEQPSPSYVEEFPEDSPVSGSDHPGNFPPEDPHGYGLRHEEGLPEAGQETAGAHSEVPAEKMESVVAAPKEVMIEEFKLDDATSVKISGLNSQINDLNVEIGEIDKQIDHIKIGANPTGDLPGRPGMTVDELVAEKERLTEDAFYLAKERNATYGLSVMRYVSEDKPNIWREIKNLPANQLLEDKKGLVYKFYAKISGYNVENFKGNIKPELGETLEKWIPRVVKMRTR